MELIALDPSIVTYQREPDETKPTHDRLPRGRGITTSSGTAPNEEKLVLEYFCILQARHRGKVGATGGSPIRTITIRLPDVEAATFVKVQKSNMEINDLRLFPLAYIRREYEKAKEE